MFNIKTRISYLRNLVLLLKLYMKGTDSKGISFDDRQLFGMEEAICFSIKTILTGIVGESRKRTSVYHFATYKEYSDYQFQQMCQKHDELLEKGEIDV